MGWWLYGCFFLEQKEEPLIQIRTYHQTQTLQICPQIFVPVAKPIMMSEILNITAHSWVFGRRGDRIAQTEGKGNFRPNGMPACR
jgi:hypothetical protein